MTSNEESGRTTDVLLLNTFDTSGGAARAIHRIHRGLRRTGVNSRMLVRRRDSNDPTVLGSPTRAHTGFAILRKHLDSVPLAIYPNRLDPLFSLAWVPDRIDSRVRSLDPDLVHLCWVNKGYMRLETLRSFDRPIVWTMEDMWPFTGGCHYSGDCGGYRDSCGSCPQLGSGRDWDLSRWVWGRKHRAWNDIDLTVVAPSTWLADRACESSLLGDRRIEVIPNSLDVDRFKPLDQSVARKSWNLPQDPRIVLFGAIDVDDPRKGFHHLRTAVDEFGGFGVDEDIELAVFGSSQPEDEWQFDYRTHYLGYLHDDVSLALAYSAADVMVVPSIEEAFGQTGSEALACGTPVAAFDGTGLSDVVDHRETGYLADPFDPIDLATGIEWIIEDDDRLEALSQRARAKAESNFALDVVAEQYAELYDVVI